MELFSPNFRYDWKPIAQRANAGNNMEDKQTVLESEVYFVLQHLDREYYCVQWHSVRVSEENS